MVGIDVTAQDAGTEVEVPMGLPLRVHLPAAEGPWEQVAGGSPVLAVEALEPGEDGTTVRLTAEGPGATELRFRAGPSDELAFPVRVTEPLMNE